MAVGLMAHLSSCLFFYMAYLDGLGDNTWVAAYGVQEAGECEESRTMVPCSSSSSHCDGRAAWRWAFSLAAKTDATVFGVPGS